ESVDGMRRNEWTKCVGISRWWISLILVFLLTLLANTLSPLLLEKLSLPEEPPGEGILRRVDDVE
ncbi:MAG: hypothetical protein OXK77_06935, partial [Gemmatimonadota bacterium]|nr:hypothetical protein [Gemmatimonadota bacterium]MDE2863508.1 hypothetical protein [Gemmatimonadota bacterium]